MEAAGLIKTIILLTAIALVASIFYYESKLKVPPIPTLPWVKRKIIKALQKFGHDTKDLKIAELGSGWGTLAFAIGKRWPDAQIKGYELSLFPYLFSNLFSPLYKNVRFERADIFEQDLGQYDALIYYLCPAVLDRLADKIRAECGAGTVIISNGFPLPGFNPVETYETKILTRIPIFIYRVGEEK